MRTDAVAAATEEQGTHPKGPASWVSSSIKSPLVTVPMGCGLTVLVLAFAYAGNPYIAGIIIETLFWVGAASAWNILGGYTGLLSLGHALFVGAGSYGVAYAVLHGWSWWLATPTVVIGVTLSGTLVLYTGFRLRGPFFSLATFALPLIAATLAVYAKSITGGAEGITWPIKPSTSDFVFVSRMPYVLVVGAIATASIAACLYIDRRAIGRNMRAVADDQIAAEASGVSSTTVRLVATAISIALTTLAGCFYITYIAFVDPASAFSLDVSLKVVLIAILGGLGRPLGPLLGAVLLIPADSWLADQFPGGVHILLYACLLIVLVLFLPKGLIGGVTQLISAIRTRHGRRG